jgi:hypothetical protein
LTVRVAGVWVTEFRITHVLFRIPSERVAWASINAGILTDIKARIYAVADVGGCIAP